MPRPRLRAGAGAASSVPLFVAYYRVSTDQQGRSGLGLEAQKAAVASFMAGQAAGRLIAEYEEVESGKRNDRPELAACRATLVIAKIDRLARNARFLLSVVEGSGDAGVAFCDLPQVPPGPTGKFLLTLLAAVAELEAGLISQRTKAALAAAKARGVKLGGRKVVAGFDTAAARSGRAAQTARAVSYADNVLPYIEAAQRAGASSLRLVAEALTARGIRPPSGGEVWHATQVRRILQSKEATNGTPQAGR